ncbi:MAG: hypothetical protein DRJ40_01590 [Thermoprotei archaeon]|nr:MAG: hypothetical protein DRJ40_01590 [Thermoprotei archaeon]
MSKQPIEEWMERHRKEPDIVVKEKAERFLKAVELKEPDRVPLMFFTCGHVFAKWFKLSEVYFNYSKMRDAIVKFVTTFPSDIFIAAPAAEGFVLAVAFADVPQIAPVVRFITGPMHDILKDKWTRWPGRELAEHLPFQFIGGEYMKPEEYKYLIENPVEFIHNTILPRACENLSKPGSAQHAHTIAKLALEAINYLNALTEINNTLLKLGFPPLAITFAYAPLDFIGDFLRHPTGAMLDIRRRPDEVKQATEALIKPILQVAFILKPTGAKFAFIPLHLNSMLSPKLYDEFYWPYLKRVITELYSNGIKSFVLFEGDHTPHLDTILELPKGWGIGVFERGDIRKIKEKLEGHTCVAGGILPGQLIGWSPEKIEEYVRELIKDLAPGGGFILAPGIAEIDPAIPDANLRALINAVLKYGARK